MKCEFTNVTELHRVIVVSRVNQNLFVATINNVQKPDKKSHEAA